MVNKRNPTLEPKPNVQRDMELAAKELVRMYEVRIPLFCIFIAVSGMFVWACMCEVQIPLYFIFIKVPGMFVCVRMYEVRIPLYCIFIEVPGIFVWACISNRVLCQDGRCVDPVLECIRVNVSA